jgi:hypothetical protein
MRAGALCAAAVALATAGTAALVTTGMIGKPKPVAAAPAAETSPTIADMIQRSVRQIPAAPVVSGPAAPTVVAAPPSEPVPVAPVVAAAPPSAPAPVDTTGSVAPPPRGLQVKGDRVALRQGPASTAKLLSRLKAGAPLVEIGREGDWVRVRASGSEGWISAAFLEPKPR